MELRSAEQDVTALRIRYGNLRRWSVADLEQHLPQLIISDDDDDPSSENDSTAAEQKSALQALHTLEQLREQTLGLKAKMVKFQKRSKEKDPVTEKPRYGEKTLARVKKLLLFYEDLEKAISIAFGETATTTTDEESAIHQLRREANVEEKERNKKLREEQEENERLEAMRMEKERQLAQEKKLAEEAAQLEQQRQRDEIARQAEQARLALLRSQEDAQRADKEWVDGITKGPEGVKQQLGILVESTKDDRTARLTAISALHTLFSQIVSRPEEPNFRRIRRDHPRFHQEIGRHAGGKEILIAAGFTLGAIDDVPSFISVEPNIEKAMDEWSTWFDVLKQTLEIIEAQMIQ